ncbi:hypothetical protein [Bauldia sp.]|uniref:hypothetical protein n=1 Tax=Bauldia sp. TaxID=2575872 RepID=UPI003BAC1D2F
MLAMTKIFGALLFVLAIGFSEQALAKTTNYTCKKATCSTDVDVKQRAINNTKLPTTFTITCDLPGYTQRDVPDTATCSKASNSVVSSCHPVRTGNRFAYFHVYFNQGSKNAHGNVSVYVKCPPPPPDDGRDELVN